MTRFFSSVARFFFPCVFYSPDLMNECDSLCASNETIFKNIQTIYLSFSLVTDNDRAHSDFFARWLYSFFRNNELFCQVRLFNEQQHRTLWKCTEEQWTSESRFIFLLYCVYFQTEDFQKHLKEIVVSLYLASCLFVRASNNNAVWLLCIAWKIVIIVCLCDTIYIQCPFDGIKTDRREI